MAKSSREAGAFGAFWGGRTAPTGQKREQEGQWKQMGALMADGSWGAQFAQWALVLSAGHVPALGHAAVLFVTSG